MQFSFDTGDNVSAASTVFACILPFLDLGPLPDRERKSSLKLTSASAQRMCLFFLSEPVLIKISSGDQELGFIVLFFLHFLAPNFKVEREFTLALFISQCTHQQKMIVMKFDLNSPHQVAFW